MKKALLLLGAIILVSFFACGNGCLLHTRELTIVVTQFVCSEFNENHDDENYMDEIVDVTQDFWEDLDEILADNGMTHEDIIEAEVLGIYYKIITGPTNPPWDVAGRFWVNVDGVEELIADYQFETLLGPTDYVELIPVQDGLDLLSAALEQYLTATDPSEYPVVFFKADRETGDIDPSPTPAEPFIMTWHGCLQMRVDFVEEFDVYDMFPAD
jgi:hypothetical protein